MFLSPKSYEQSKSEAQFSASVQLSYPQGSYLKGSWSLACCSPLLRTNSLPFLLLYRCVFAAKQHSYQLHYAAQIRNVFKIKLFFFKVQGIQIRKYFAEAIPPFCSFIGINDSLPLLYFQLRVENSITTSSRA